MNSYPPLTDESAVAAFLSGTEERRDEATLYLIQHHDARELLCMAQEALDAVQLPPHRTSHTPKQRQNVKRKHNEWTKHSL